MRCACRYYTRNNYSLTINMTDNGAAGFPPISILVSLAVQVLHVNHAPTMSASTFSVPENAAPGTRAGAVGLIDLLAQGVGTLPVLQELLSAPFAPRILTLGTC